MKAAIAFALLLSLYGCDSVSSGHWVQSGYSDVQMTEDFRHCEKVAMLESDGQRSVEPFKEERIKQSCMERKGYSYEKKTR